MAKNAVGPWFGTFMALDATVVLAAGVLTSFVGVGGLMKRLALDRCLPQFFLATNKWRGTNHVITLSFYGLCASLLLILDGNITELSGVFAVAFLSVMVRHGGTVAFAVALAWLCFAVQAKPTHPAARRSPLCPRPRPLQLEFTIHGPVWAWDLYY